MKKRNKRSWGQHLRYQKPKIKKDIIKIAWVLAFVALLGFYANNLQITQATEAIDTFQGRLPVSEDKKLGVKERILIVANQENFQWNDYLLRLAWCESIKICGEGSETCYNARGNYPANSVDRGVFMINDYWQPGVSNECAFNIECATRWTINKINAGYQHLWACDKLI